MNNGETNTRDQRVIDAYRAASQALDERPQPATRAAILAAAARAVDAQPHDAGTGATSRRQAQRARSLIQPSRRPLALVASFLVATVVLAMVMRTQEQQETSSVATLAANEPAAKPDAAAAPPNQVAVAPAQAPAPAPAQPSVTERIGDAELKSKREGHGPTTSLATPGVAAADKVATEPAARVALPEVRPQAPARVAAPAPSEERPQLRRELALADRSEPQAAAERSRSNLAEQMASKPAAIAAAPPPAASPPAAPEVEQASRDTTKRQALAARSDERAATETDAGAASGKLAKARPVERTAALAGDSVEADPVRWSERLIALRDAGRDDDADRELVRLRERYPDFKLPPNALRRAGTR